MRAFSSFEDQVGCGIGCQLVTIRIYVDLVLGATISIIELQSFEICFIYFYRPISTFLNLKTVKYCKISNPGFEKF